MPLISLHNHRQSIFNLPVAPDGDYWYQQTEAGLSLKFNSIDYDGDDNSYCVGQHSSMTELGSAAMLCKYDNLGALVYSYVITPSLYDAKLRVDRVNGVLYIAGHATGIKNDIVVLKLSLDGTLLWQYRYGTDYDDYAVGELVVSGSNVYVGFTYSNTTTPAYGMSVLSITDSGIYVANRAVTHTTNKTVCSGLTVDPTDGSVYVCGYYGPSNGILWKLSSSLTQTFQKTLPMVPHAIHCDADSSVYIAGATVSGTIETHLLKLNASGASIFQYRYSDQDSDSSGAPDESFIRVSGLSLDTSGNIYIAGTSSLTKRYATLLKVSSSGSVVFRSRLENKSDGAYTDTTLTGFKLSGDSVFMSGYFGVFGFSARLPKVQAGLGSYDIVDVTSDPVTSAAASGAVGALSYANAALSYTANSSASLSLGAPSTVTGEFDNLSRAWTSAGDTGSGGFEYLFNSHLASEYADSTCTDSQGNVYVIVSGNTSSSAEAYLRKYTSSGTLVFEKYVPYACSVTTYGTSDIYVGTTVLAYTYTSGSNTWPSSIGSALLYRLNQSTGAVVWCKMVLEAALALRSLRCDTSGNLVVAGIYRHRVSTGGTGYGSYVAKFSSAGVMLWRKGIWYMGSAHDGSALAITSDGTIVTMFAGPTSNGGNHLGFVSYDTNGNLLSRKAILGTSNTWRETIFRIVNRANTLYAGGVTNIASGLTYTSYRFMLSLSTDGSKLSQKTITEPMTHVSDLSKYSVASFTLLDPSSTDVFQSSANFIARYNNAGALQNVYRINGMVREITATHYVVVRAIASEERIDVVFLPRSATLPDITSQMTENTAIINSNAPGTGYMNAVTPDYANYGGQTTGPLDGTVFDYESVVTDSEAATRLSIASAPYSVLQAL